MTDEKTTPAAEPQAEAAPSTEGTQSEKEAVKNPKKEKAEKKKDLAAELEAAKAKADAAEKETAQLRDQLLRTAAEYDNFRKRSAREQDSAFGNGVSHAVEKILTILDTLEMAANAPTTDEAYKKGVVMTLEKAAAAFEALKVEEIPALNLPFDPEVHSAVMQQPAAEGQESGTVVQVFQKGYKLGDKVVRHATVVVAE